MSCSACRRRSSTATGASSRRRSCPISRLRTCCSLNLFRGLDASLEEAAGTMGAHPGKVLTTVSLPLLVPGLAGACVLLFGYSFADLGNPLLLGGDFPVLSSQIYLAIIGQYDIPKGAALAIILLGARGAALLFPEAPRCAHGTCVGRWTRLDATSPGASPCRQA